MNWREKTARDVVEAWDNGEPIWTVEMGGLGPGYEQCIHIMMIEILRDNLDKVLPEPDADEDSREVGALAMWGHDTITRINKDLGGVSGAQADAARSLAYRILKNGYPETIESMQSHDPSRLIQVSNNWPRVKAS